VRDYRYLDITLTLTLNEHNVNTFCVLDCIGASEQRKGKGGNGKVMLLIGMRQRGG
jgi:hypothetical protein